MMYLRFKLDIKLMQQVWEADQDSHDVKVFRGSRIVATFKLELGKPVQSVDHLHLELSATTMQQFLFRPVTLLHFHGIRADSTKMCINVTKFFNMLGIPVYSGIFLENMREARQPKMR